MQLEPAGFWVRLMAIVYESLLLLAILFAATGLVLLIHQAAIPPGTVWFELYLYGVMFGYFGYCWLKSGQTLGMLAWRLMLTDVHGKRVTLGRAALRYVIATVLGCGVIGLLWMWIDQDDQALQDRLSGTRVVRLPKNVQREKLQ
jgi:uncharacterized RDD family membrane protein YckC